MLVSTIVGHLAAKDARKLEQDLRRTAKRKAKAAAGGALASAPVRLAERLDPNAALYVAASVTFDAVAPAPTHTVDEAITDATGRTHSVRAPFISEDDGYFAALRRQLAADEPFGPTVVRAVRYRDAAGGEVKEMVMRGRLSDILRTLPDADSRQLWTEAHVMGLTAKGVRIPLQMEALSR